MTSRICLATDSLEPSGVGQHMVMLGAGLSEAVDIVVACPDSAGGSALLDRAAEAGLGIRKLPDDPIAVVDWLRRHKFAALHIHAGIGWEGHDLAAAGRAANVPTIVRTEHLPDLITDAAQRGQYRAGIALVDRVICVSEASAASHRAAGAPDPVTIRNGITVRPGQRSRASIRSELGIRNDQPLVLTAARFTAQKDHATLVAAVPSVLARNPETCFVLAGDGPLLEDVRHAAAELGVGPAIRMLGHRSDVPDLLGAADLFVLPSRFEGLPLAVLEAMAAGVPVVATRIGGTEEAVLDGTTGQLVRPGDPAELAAAISAALGDRDASARRGLAGRHRFLMEFTAKRMAASTLELYRSLGVAAESTNEVAGMNDAKTGRTRLGFVGAGGIANRHLGVLESFDDVELAAFADPARERAVAAAERFGAKVYGDVDSRSNAVLPAVPTLPAAAADRWRAAWGEEAVQGIARAIAAPPPLDVTLADPAQTDRWCVELDGVSLAPGHVRIAKHPPVPDMPGYAEGAWWVQDIAASIPVRLLGPGAGTALDLCAAPGGKTLQLAAAGWTTTAVDLAPKRIERLRENFARTALSVAVVTADLLDWTPPAPVDAVLLDAPCSATGIVRRHPETLYRVLPRLIAEMAEVQAALLARAADWVKPGGSLVYATCSLEREEGEAQAEAFLAARPDFTVQAPAVGVLPAGIVATEQGWVRTLPGMLADAGGCDGFFAVRFVRAMA